MRRRTNAIDYDSLVEEHRVHADCYLDPDIFEDEIEQIFYRGWVYVGHESEVPEPGDFVRARIGRQSPPEGRPRRHRDVPARSLKRNFLNWGHS